MLRIQHINRNSLIRSAQAHRRPLRAYWTRNEAEVLSSSMPVRTCVHAAVTTHARAPRMPTYRNTHPSHHHVLRHAHRHAHTGKFRPISIESPDTTGPTPAGVPAGSGRVVKEERYGKGLKWSAAVREASGKRGRARRMHTRTHAHTHTHTHTHRTGKEKIALLESVYLADAGDELRDVEEHVPSGSCVCVCVCVCVHPTSSAGC